MNLDDLRPAWRRFTVLSALQPVHQDEIGLILAGAEQASRARRFVIPMVMFILLNIFCQGG